MFLRIGERVAERIQLVKSSMMLSSR